MKAILLLLLSLMLAGGASSATTPKRDRTVHVVVEFVISEQGKPEDIRVVSSTDPAFNEPAIRAVLKRQFKPVVKNGRPVKTRTNQLFEFNRADKLNNPPPAER
jgi:TonB family protein